VSTATETPTPTDTPVPTNTPKPTNTASPVPTATKVVPAQSSAVDHDGCNMSQPGSRGALLWLLVPAAIMAYRRRR
jgi:hypothetical protein